MFDPFPTMESRSRFRRQRRCTPRRRPGEPTLHLRTHSITGSSCRDGREMRGSASKCPHNHRPRIYRFLAGEAKLACALAPSTTRRFIWVIPVGETAVYLVVSTAADEGGHDDEQFASVGRGFAIHPREPGRRSSYDGCTVTCSEPVGSPA